jgi:uncharacterized protein YdiU (UPF0061 family)
MVEHHIRAWEMDAQYCSTIFGAEAMHYLQVPTTRSLSIVGTDDPVYRERKETQS